MNNSKFSKQNILKGVSVIIGALIISFSNLSLIFNMPTLGKPSVFGTLIGIAFFIFAILLHFLDLNHEINTLRSKVPNIVFGESKCVEITSEQVDLYGEKSLIGSRALHRKIYLFCIDFFNKPFIPNGNNAEGCQVLIEFYDKDDDRQASYLGRWIDMPEYEFGIVHKTRNIPCNRLSGDRLGIAIIDNKGDDFFLLDSSLVDNRSDGSIWNPPHLLSGKYTVVLTVLGENFPDISKVYEIQNLKDERVIFSEKRNAEVWLKKVDDDRNKLSKLFDYEGYTKT